MCEHHPRTESQLTAQGQAHLGGDQQPFSAEPHLAAYIAAALACPWLRDVPSGAQFYPEVLCRVDQVQDGTRPHSLQILHQGHHI